MNHIAVLSPVFSDGWLDHLHCYGFYRHLRVGTLLPKRSDHWWDVYTRFYPYCAYILRGITSSSICPVRCLDYFRLFSKLRR